MMVYVMTNPGGYLAAILLVNESHGHRRILMLIGHSVLTPSPI